MRWFELTPLSITHVLAPPECDRDAKYPQKRGQVENSDTDEERPRKYAVVLSEVGQRMREKQQLRVDRGLGLREFD